MAYKTTKQAVAWLKAQSGKKLDYDGMYGAQCVDAFNFYYKWFTGISPYADGYGVAGAKDLWNCPNPKMTKIANNPKDPNQIPKAGDVMIYNSRWGAGWGHVEMIISATTSKYTVLVQNNDGKGINPCTIVTRSYDIGGTIGWLRFKEIGKADAMEKEIATLKAQLAAEKKTKEALAKQVADVKKLLDAEKNKPPVQVVKEVEKIVEKVVEVERPIDEQAVVQNWLARLWNSLFKK